MTHRVPWKMKCKVSIKMSRKKLYLCPMLLSLSYALCREKVGLQGSGPSTILGMWHHTLAHLPPTPKHQAEAGGRMSSKSSPEPCQTPDTVSWQSRRKTKLEPDKLWGLIRHQAQGCTWHWVMRSLITCGPGPDWKDKHNHHLHLSGEMSFAHLHPAHRWQSSSQAAFWSLHYFHYTRRPLKETQF